MAVNGNSVENLYQSIATKKVRSRVASTRSRVIESFSPGNAVYLAVCVDNIDMVLICCQICHIVHLDQGFTDEDDDGPTRSEVGHNLV